MHNTKKKNNLYEKYNYNEFKNEMTKSHLYGIKV